MPAPPPAGEVRQYVLRATVRISTVPIRLVAAEAGFFPPWPFPFFADIVGNWNCGSAAMRAKQNGKKAVIEC